MSAFAAAGAAYGRLTLLADPTDVGDETHKAGPIAILIVLLLCIACFFLFRSMTKHMRRVRDGFPGDQQPPTAGGASGAPVAADGREAVVVRKTARSDAVDETPRPG